MQNGKMLENYYNRNDYNYNDYYNIGEHFKWT